MSILRRWFGPSKREIWRQVSEEVDGRFVEGSFGQKDRIQATHGEWTVTLDKHVVPIGKTVVVYTRMRAPYVNPDGFRFSISRRGLFSGIATWLGMQDIEIGDERFDRDFVIKGNNEAQVRTLLSNPRIRELIALQPDINFAVKDDEGWFGPHFPQGVDELQFIVVGMIKDVERLKLLFELFSETLDQLCRIGSAYEQAPDVTV
jgi:hypothetical protein